MGDDGWLTSLVCRALFSSFYFLFAITRFVVVSLRFHVQGTCTCGV